MTGLERLMTASYRTGYFDSATSTGWYEAERSL